jgi:hypothetical protein
LAMFFNIVVTLVTPIAIVDIQELHDVFNEILCKSKQKVKHLE